jgi:large subunit ribosomal protein L22
METLETPTEFRAEAKYVRAAPRKAQLVVSEIRGLQVAEARTALTFMTRAAARDVAKVLASAVANAENHPDYNGEDLVISSAVVGSGPTLKRWRARARGRVGRIKKRTCHITIRLVAVEPEVATKRRAKAEPEAAPKRARRPKAEAEAVSAPAEPPAIDEAEADAPGEEKPKPARARRAKPAGEAPVTPGEKPKPARPRATRKKADEAPAEAVAEKPKRAPRKKAEAAAEPAEQGAAEPVAETPAEKAPAEASPETASAEGDDS